MANSGWSVVVATDLSSAASVTYSSKWARAATAVKGWWRTMTWQVRTSSVPR